MIHNNITIDVELEILDRSTISYQKAKEDVNNIIIDPLLKSNVLLNLLAKHQGYYQFDLRDNTGAGNEAFFNLKKDIRLIKVYDHSKQCKDISDDNISNHPIIVQIYPYKLVREDSVDEDVDNPEESSPYQLTILPNYQYSTLWENLIYDGNVKSKLLQYLSTIIKFSKSNIDHNIISHNKIILLNGPPGTGKTSLCKALAQKVAITQNTNTSLIEINSHSLFSKWFSESGKLVMKVFEKIKELAEDVESLVIVLIDEVESLTAARKAAISGGEPSDSIRVVNAFLTQLDRLKYYPNILILTTSNLVGAVDIAFIDRVDIKQFIGPPSNNARMEIFLSCLKELESKKLIINNDTTNSDQTISLIRELANLSDGFSGRSLRKIPFITFSNISLPTPIDMKYFLEAMKNTLLSEIDNNSKIEKL